MIRKHRTGSLLALVSLVALTTAGCLTEPDPSEDGDEWGAQIAEVDELLEVESDPSVDVGAWGEPIEEVDKILELEDLSGVEGIADLLDREAGASTTIWLTSDESTIQREHSRVIGGGRYYYDNTTKYNGQTLPRCARQELDKIVATGVRQHYPCTAGKVKNLRGSAHSSTVPGVNWVATVAAWEGSSGHKATILRYRRVGCSQIAPSQSACKRIFNSNFPFCRLYSCAYSD